jgi:peroxiredoxin
MNVTRLTGIFLILAVTIIGCKKGNQFTINGKVSHAEGKTLYLEELLVSSTKPVDSVRINKNGEFKIKGESKIPTYYLLKFSPDKMITLLVDSAENVVIEADYANFSNQYHVEGSLGSVLVKQLVDKLNTTKLKLDSLESLYNIYREDPGYESMKAKWEEQYDAIVKEQVDFSTGFVMNNPFSMASVLALYQEFDQQNFVIKDFHTMRVAASALNSIYPNSEHVKALYANTVQLLKEEKSAKIQQLIEQEGQNSPEIILPDANGKEIALSSLKGKVVLLQFWAAVDRNSRVLNPALAEAYQKYKNKGFEIYQVSLDENRIEWIDAIDKDGLKWINVGDMKGSIQAVQNYNIQAIPYNYLLDTEGKIVAQNLKGPGLDRVLAKILK